ncbi:pre-rRNA-processing protein ESF1 [Skeletonema marinoi]|uniref:Pre-rRNA-processing protein ESF1 n=1 Tax=Skeletonema marinoi TaxID=267567 RepID=A0AAD9D3M3_9STRA|nr:pre-rRNA-processing protein ESF1 [Skeletonema marinoi]
MKKKGGSNNSNDEIVDERFLAATNRPQFRSGGGRRRHKSNSSDHDGKTTSNDDNDNNKQGESSGTLHSTNVDDDNTDGFGESLTQAIRSDDRFSEALTNSDKFGCVPGMDKYGRKIKKSKKKSRRDDDDSGDDGESGDEQKEQAKKKDNAPMDMESRIAYLNALSRGDISASSSEEEDDDDDSSDDDNDDDDDSSTSSTNIHGQAGVFDPTYNQLPGDYQQGDYQQELTTDPTPYLCILNLDWEHTRAVDVYAMLHSFCPPGTLKRVDIYPSDFGREMMEKERVEGPSGLWKKDWKQKNKKSDGDDGNHVEEDDDSSSSSDEDSSSSGEKVSGAAAQDGNISEQHNDDDESDSDEDNDEEEEDILNLDEATAKLYSHFPPQSEVMKNSQLQTEEEEEEGFDREKLRAYEASKLRYYFAIATFSNASAAEPVYENVDGMEMEHSAAEIDVRALPVDQYDETIEGRELHDSCNHLPGKYAPPDNVVTALRQSKVTCSWERGDSRREKALTKWGIAKDAWDAMNEGDDIKFYLASDNSSAGEESDDDGDGDLETETKSRKMRALLGLSGSEDEDDAASDNDGSSDGSDEDAGKNAESLEASSESESEDEAEAKTKQVTFTPGKKNLEEKIRSKLNGETAELTPFQKYLEKRKEKRRERRQAARKKGKGMESDSEEEVGEDDAIYGVDPEFGVAKFSDEESVDSADIGKADGDDDDDFFLEDAKSSSQKKKGKKPKGKDEEAKAGKNNRMASTKEELELLIAGDDDEEDAKDFDMRGLEKLEKHANKKLRGKRKRQLENLAANVSGQGFQVDTKDDRFSALLEGIDDRFGIDRTNPAFKETTAMKTLLQEQSKRRKKNRGKSNEKASDKSKQQQHQADGKGGNKNDSWVESSSGAMELSSLVKSLQTKVKSTDKPKKKKLRQ